jgi:hypothetical protein
MSARRFAPRLAALRRYALFTAAANLLWESAHAPLYTLWANGTTREITFAVLHCTAGDLLIASACLVVALALVGHGGWPTRRAAAVALTATVLGTAYAIYNERMNLDRGAWQYSDAMPLVPPFGIGLSPLLQWLILPPVGLAWACAKGPHESAERA